MAGAAPRAQPPDAKRAACRQAARFVWGVAYCLIDAMSITNRYFTSLFSIRS